MDDSYDLILVGSSFASSFFLHRYLALAPAGARVLVLERGEWLEHGDHIAGDTQLGREARQSFSNRTPAKPWIFKLAFGGSSNCWAACTPRMTEADFEQHSLYGRGVDWPLRYDDLERFYCEAEEIMAVSGPSGVSPTPRSRPYPQPPHQFSVPDQLLKRAYPDQYFEQACARPTRPTDGGRPRCCANSVCHLCPIDSKFTVLNELRHLYEKDPRVTLQVGAQVESVDHAGNVATGVRYRLNGESLGARGELIGLGANAIFNPFLLLRSGLEGPEVGRGLVEQCSVGVDILLDGVDGFQGSTLIPANGYMLYDGPHRSERAAALIESHNAPRLRDERGKWRQRLILKIVFEDLRQANNRVTLSPDDPDRPTVQFLGRSEYTLRGMAALPDVLPELLSPLPIEELRILPEPYDSDAHVIGTTPMGEAGASVVDRGLRHHRLRNLLVLGSSVFPTCAPANPTLTLSALSLWAAESLFA